MVQRTIHCRAAPTGEMAFYPRNIPLERKYCPLLPKAFHFPLHCIGGRELCVLYVANASFMHVAVLYCTGTLSHTLP